jgi:hypothetical protein
VFEEKQFGASRAEVFDMLAENGIGAREHRRLIVLCIIVDSVLHLGQRSFLHFLFYKEARNE